MNKTLKILVLLAIGVFFGLMFSPLAFAGGYVPQADDQIVVMRDGKVIGNMSRSEYKVVKIEDSIEYVPVKTKELVRLMDSDHYRKSHHSVILQMGMGPGGMNVNNDNNQWQVQERFRPMIGGTYCYTITKTGVCLSGYSNKTALIGIKQDFNFN